MKHTDGRKDAADEVTSGCDYEADGGAESKFISVAKLFSPLLNTQNTEIESKFRKKFLVVSMLSLSSLINSRKEKRNIQYLYMKYKARSELYAS